MLSLLSSFISVDAVWFMLVKMRIMQTTSLFTQIKVTYYQILYYVLEKHDFIFYKNMV